MVQNIMEVAEIHADYSQFEVHEIFVGTISQWSSKEMHVVKEGSIDTIQSDDTLEDVFWLPQLYEKFYLREVDVLLRALRVAVDETHYDPCKHMALKFIDTGEIFTIPIADLPLLEMYTMSETVKQMPALAIKCRWNDIEVGYDQDYDNEETFLKNSVSKTFAFEVLSVDEDMLTVNILPYDDGSFSESESILLSEEEASGVNLEMMSVPFGTQEERDILYEEPLNTNDALIAVQGFHTRDDEKICKFYDPNIGGCFKGGRCKLIHIKPSTDGTCRDSNEMHLRIPETLPNPMVNSKVKLEITSVLSVNTFMCRYYNLKKPRHGITLEGLMEDLNDPSVIKKFVPLKELPAYNQLVLVKFNDGKFHRARVESLANEDFLVDLHLVDKGVMEKVHIKMIYNWCLSFNYLPFQSIIMEIANILPMPNASIDQTRNATDVIMQLNNKSKYLKGIVTENIVAIKVRLLTLEDVDIGEQLISLGLAVHRQVQPETIQAGFHMFYVPG